MSLNERINDILREESITDAQVVKEAAEKAASARVTADELLRLRLIEQDQFYERFAPIIESIRATEILEELATKIGDYRSAVDPSPQVFLSNTSVPEEKPRVDYVTLALRWKTPWKFTKSISSTNYGAGGNLGPQTQTINHTFKGEFGHALGLAIVTEDKLDPKILAYHATGETTQYGVLNPDRSRPITVDAAERSAILLGRAKSRPVTADFVAEKLKLERSIAEVYLKLMRSGNYPPTRNQ